MNTRIKSLIYLLALLSILTVNIYVPAIPTLQQTFATTKAHISLTVSFYMLGLAIGIPLYGAIADHIKTSKVLIFGLTLYIIANLIAIFSPNISTFIFARFVEGLSAASALCLWQVLSFTYFEDKAKHMINSGFIIIGSMPALAPMFGGLILSFSHWQALFFTLTILAIILIGLTLSLPAANAASQIKKTQHQLEQTHIVLSILRQYKHLVVDAQFMILAFASATIYMSVYVYLSQVPFLLTKLHFATKSFSLFFIPISVAFILGGLFSKFLLKKGSSFKHMFMLPVAVTTIVFILVVIAELAGVTLSAWLLAIPFFIFTIGAGIGMPNLVSQALSLHPHRRGTAASAIGLVQNLFAFAFSSLGAYLTRFGYEGLVVSYALMTGLLILWFGIYLFISHRKKSFLETCPTD
ncbi:MFS transporter [Cysteiniphilum sp. 6C5]|uniref:MFS transporter n=1 Tax=unclassified Cysteiniphilum TaxID=2610889 RepID=UPI003F850911